MITLTITRTKFCDWDVLRFIYFVLHSFIHYSLNHLIMLRNLSIEEFKGETNVQTISIVRNPNTKKLFASAGGVNYRVQGEKAKAGELDVKKTIEFMYEDDDTVDNSGIENGCFVNQGADNVLHTM